MSTLPRRQFLARTTATLAGAALTRRGLAATTPNAAELSSTPPVIVSTWPFGKPANEEALATLRRGGSGLDAVEQGIRVTESDPNNPSVGLAGIPNAAGVVQLDACIMSGPGHKAGAVAAVEGFAHPISIARRVMETTPHVLLVGEGAMEFATKNGLERGPKVSAKQRAAWRKWRSEQKAAHAKSSGNHDTI
ncbi:MAG TPA: glycosylasparaginase, partial [Verrucomicrobiales bacterium]|nr:glycosylasparaginase [Verrucomicrobiales bacterium]